MAGVSNRSVFDFVSMEYGGTGESPFATALRASTSEPLRSGNQLLRFCDIEGVRRTAGLPDFV